MITANLRTAKAVIKMAIVKKKSVLLLGEPGIGKTEIFEQVCSEGSMGFLCWEAPSMDPTDVRGVLIPKGDRSFYTKSALLPEVERHGKAGIILIDEITSGLPAVQVALHALFHPRERRLGNDRLPDGWIPMATGNYASDMAGATTLLTAFSDRVCVVNVIPDFGIWKNDYAIPRDIHPIVTGFLDFRIDLFSTFEKRKKGDNGKSFGSARTHTQVSDFFYYADEEKISDADLQVGIAGYVGEGISVEYMAFRKIHHSLPDMGKIFAGENIVPEEPSQLYAICSALRHHVKDFGKSLQAAIDRVLDYSKHLDAEFGALLIRDMFVKYEKEVVKSKHWVEVSKRY